MKNHENLDLTPRHGKERNAAEKTAKMLGFDPLRVGIACALASRSRFARARLCPRLFDRRSTRVQVEVLRVYVYVL